MDRKQKSKAAENNDRNAERNLAELFAAHNLLQSNPLALLQQQMNVMAQQAGPAFFNPNSNPYNNNAAIQSWLYLDYISRIQAAQQMLPGLNEQQQQQRSSTSTTTPVTASSSGTNPTPSSSSSSRPTKQSRQPANKKIKLPADTDIIRMASNSSNQRSTPPRKLPQHSMSRKNQPPKESPPNVQLFKIEDNDAPLNLSKKTLNPPLPKHPPHPLIVKDRDPHPKLNNNNNVTIIPHAHTKPENLSTPPGRYPHDFVPKPAHMTKSSWMYSHVIPKIPQVGMVVKPNEKLVKKKTTVASLLAQSRVQQQESSAASSRSSSPEANNIDIRSSPTAGDGSPRSRGAPHRPWVNNPAPLVIPNIKPLQQLQHQRSSQDSSAKKPLHHHQSLPPPHQPPPMPQKHKNQHQQQLSSAQQQQSQSSENSTTDSSAGPASNSTPADLAQPLNMGWKRETLLKGLGAQGLSGEVVYISPLGVKCKQLSEVKKHLTAGLSIKMFSFSSRLLVGDFLLPTNSTEEQNTTLKLSANQLANWLSSEGEENKKEEIRLKEERERKKQHSVLVRALELHRRAKRRQKLQNDRKLRKKAELLEQQQAMQQQQNSLIPQQQLLQQQQQQLQQQQLQQQQDASISEMDEMAVEQALPELSRVKGLRLSPQAFANLLQIYEFLHTFGETLGFDMESLPTMSNLQKAFLHVDENEEELLSVISHLLVCAVEDPGMPNPNKHITAFGQTLKQADITFGSLSEVLRLFLEGVADSEPEAEKYSEWLHQAPFLALSPTRKSSILAFLCDLLLQNKAVLKHLEASTEYAHTARKERQQNDIKVRRLRMLCARKAVAAASEQQEREFARIALEATPKAIGENEEAAKDKPKESKLDEKEPTGDVPKEVNDAEKDVKDVEKETKAEAAVEKEKDLVDDKEKEEETKEDKEVANSNAESTLSDPSSCPSTPATQPPSVPQTPTRTSTPSQLLPPPPPVPEEIDSEDQLEESESDADAKLSVEEIRMKMNQLNNMSEKLKRQMVENSKIIRSGCLGQDRWRRRYWNLPNSGGIYVEGGLTSEFPDLITLVKEFFVNGHATGVDEEEVMEVDVKPVVIKEEIKVEKSSNDDNPTETVEGDKVLEGKVDGDKDEKTVEGDTKVEGDKIVENEKSELEKSVSLTTQFEVPPPVIKIFSFTPRNGCSGKLVQVVEKVEEPESEDQVLLKKLNGNNEVWEGWWKISDDTKDDFLEKICTKGIRERTLSINLANVQIVEGEDFDDDEIPLNVKSPEQGWDPDLCYKVHLQLLETMETLEERVASASLQVKGWQLPSRKPDCLSEPDIIEMVKIRLLDLESAIERRYLKPPLGKSVNELNLTNLTELTTDKDKDQQQTYHGSRALTNWRDGVSRSKTPGVLSMAIYTLDSSIAWDKSVMKASCQLCKGGDNEDKLLLCDACDRGYHTYCFKPPLEQIPDGDWFCWECINKATGIKGCIVCGKQSGGGKILACDKCVKAYHLDCLNPPLAKAPRGRWHCPDHRKLGSPNRKRKSENSEKTPDGVPKQKTNNKKAKTEANWCEKILDELAGHEDAWPFLDPVNTRQFPTYKKVIKNPMDLATIRSRLATYKTRENFLADVRLIFDNCETFNEDDSPVGKAGHSLRVFFDGLIRKPKILG